MTPISTRGVNVDRKDVSGLGLRLLVPDQQISCGREVMCRKVL